MKFKHQASCLREKKAEDRCLKIDMGSLTQRGNYVRYLAQFIFLLAIGQIILFSFMQDRLKSKFSINQTVSSGSSSILLIVVVSIGKQYGGIAAESVIAYCLRHGYRLHVQKEWIGDVEKLPDPRATMTQKLLACTHAKGEKYVLLLDDDVVIGPWTPPIHLEAEKEGLGKNVGIVDEDQPSYEISQAVISWKLEYRIRPSTMEEYYGIFGEKFKVSHGMLNTGVVLYQPEEHCEWMKSVYYDTKTREYWSKPSEHYDQPVLGAALIREGKYKQLHHAWNRGWVYYKDAKHIVGWNYTLMDVWKKSYFIHFYWDKEWIKYFEAYLKVTNFTFEPQPYASSLEP